jgi:hypothetical protein
MVKLSSHGIATRVRIGFPSKDGVNFNGLAFDSHVSLGAIVFGGAVAAAIVWRSMRDLKPKPADELTAPTHLPVRGVATN